MLVHILRSQRSLQHNSTISACLDESYDQAGSDCDKAQGHRQLHMQLSDLALHTLGV